MAQSLFDVRPILTGKEIIWVSGLILGGIGYGALLTLGITSLVVIFRSRWRGGGWFGHEKILSAHVLLVLSINTFLQVWNAESNIKAIFYTEPDRITYFYHGRENISLVLLVMLTDGVLVWRCRMIQKVLPAGPSVSVWDHICWIFPAFLWYVETVISITSVALLKPDALLFDNAESNSPGIALFLVALVINFALNIFATSNIVTRLLLHRRSVIAAFGRKSGLAEYSLHISSILLESAAINLPLALLSIIGLLIHAEFASLLTQLITSGQCIASILVIYQVAKRRTISECRAINSKEGLPGTPEPSTRPEMGSGVI